MRQMLGVRPPHFQACALPRFVYATVILFTRRAIRVLIFSRCWGYAAPARPSPLIFSAATSRTLPGVDSFVQ